MVEDIINNIPVDILIAGLFATNLKQLRKQSGLSQEELSARTGINRVCIAKYETSKRLITLSNLLKFAKAFDVTPDVLLKGWQDIIK